MTIAFSFSSNEHLNSCEEQLHLQEDGHITAYLQQRRTRFHDFTPTLQFVEENVK